MPSNPPGENELLKFLLGRQDQTRSSLGESNGAANNHQMPTLSTPLQTSAPAFLEQPSGGIPSAIGERARARAAKAQKNYELLQRYLQSSGVQNNGGSVAPSGAWSKANGIESGASKSHQVLLNQSQSNGQVPQQSCKEILYLRAQEVMSREWHNMDAQQLADHILGSIQLLSEIDSNIAADAVAFALSLSSTPSHYSREQVQQQPPFNLLQQAAHIQTQAQTPTQSHQQIVASILDNQQAQTQIASREPCCHLNQTTPSSEQNQQQALCEASNQVTMSSTPDEAIISV